MAVEQFPSGTLPEIKIIKPHECEGAFEGRVLPNYVGQASGLRPQIIDLCLSLPLPPEEAANNSAREEAASGGEPTTSALAGVGI
jgi:hypothetical protein